MDEVKESLQKCIEAVENLVPGDLILNGTKGFLLCELDAALKKTQVEINITKSGKESV